MHVDMAGAASATMEGSLLKRQRGLHQRRHVFTLKFEERFFRLSPTSLEYFKGRQKVANSHAMQGLSVQVHVSHFLI